MAVYIYSFSGLKAFYWLIPCGQNQSLIPLQFIPRKKNTITAVLQVGFNHIVYNVIDHARAVVFFIGDRFNGIIHQARRLKITLLHKKGLATALVYGPPDIIEISYQLTAT